MGMPATNGGQNRFLDHIGVLGASLDSGFNHPPGTFGRSLRRPATETSTFGAWKKFPFTEGFVHVVTAAWLSVTAIIGNNAILHRSVCLRIASGVRPDSCIWLLKTDSENGGCPLSANGPPPNGSFQYDATTPAQKPTVFAVPQSICQVFYLKKCHGRHSIVLTKAKSPTTGLEVIYP